MDKTVPQHGQFCNAELLDGISSNLSISATLRPMLRTTNALECQGLRSDFDTIQ
jgi:hypothetical protein